MPLSLFKFPHIRITKFLEINELFQLLNLSKAIRVSVLKYSKILKMYLHVFHLQMRYSEDLLSSEKIQTNLKSEFFKNNFKFIRTSVNQMISEFEYSKINLNHNQIIIAIGNFLAKIILSFKDKLITNDHPYFIKNYNYENIELKILHLNSFDIDDDSIDFLLVTLNILKKHNLINGISLCNNKFSNEKIGQILQFASDDYLRLFDFSSNKISLKGLELIFAQIGKYRQNIPFYKINFLDFSDCAILDEEIELMSKYLGMNYPIEKLCLNANRFTCLTPLAKAIMLNDYIKEIRINQMNLGLNTLPFLHSLVNNNTIKKLTLDKNDMFILVPELIKVIPSMSKLIELSLINNKINDESGALLINSFENCPNLAMLSLGMNALGIQSCISLAILLNKSTCKLFTLFLQYNKIDDTGIKELMKGLETNKTIQYLELSWNQLTSQCGDYFETMLSKNTSLITLNIKQNMLLTEGSTKIIQGIISNSESKLNLLSLLGNSIDDGIVSEIKNIIVSKEKGKTKLEEIVLDCNMITIEGITQLESLNLIKYGLRLSLEVMIVD